VQLNFGVVLDESMGEAVKIAIIATPAPESAPDDHLDTPAYLRRGKLLF